MGSSERSVRALLFDLGGVLVEIDFHRVYRAWSAQAGVTPEALAARFSIDSPAYARHECGQIDAQAYFADLGGTLGVDLPAEHWTAGWNAVFVDEIAGMRERLARLQGRLPLYVFSNTNAVHHVVWSRRYADLLRPFERVFTSHELGLRKPDAAAFQAVAQAIGHDPAHILFFDDLLANVEGARAAGLQAVHVRSVADIDAALKEWT
jgi:FMN phosphatase YigB (HAD superfamily)